MKKYKCPKCGTMFEGELAACPKCGTLMKYREVISKEEEIKQEALPSAPKFKFHANDVIYHPDDPNEEELFGDEDEKEEAEKKEKQKEIKYSKLVLEDGKSYFDGNPFSHFFTMLGAFLLFVCTATLAFPWCMCMRYRYQTKHTVINGRRMTFDGKGVQLFGRYLLWLVLTILTAGIFIIWLLSSVKKWKTKHTHFLTYEEED